ncbi:MAG: hypothetical protein EPO08_16475 [Rhodospirillaceae bacterium]|nr:MAG: hypothetical protein EPO08_16475 [Rhodospirillaceae bacterium]
MLDMFENTAAAKTRARKFLLVASLVFAATTPKVMAANITEYPLPAIQPDSILVGSDKAIWISSWDTKNNITRITTDGQVTSYTIPTTPAAMVNGADGALWIAANTQVVSTQINKDTNTPYLQDTITPYIGRITTGGTYSTIYTGPTKSDNSAFLITSILAGPDGANWFVKATNDTSPQVIERVQPNGTVTEFPLPAYTSVYRSDGTLAAQFPRIGLIAANSDGSLLIDEIDTNYNKTVFHMTADGQFARMNNVPDRPFVTAADGAMWFTGGHPVNGAGTFDDSKTISRMATDGTVTDFKANIPNYSSVGGLIAGQNNDFWFIENVAVGSSTSGEIYYGAIGHITASGQITEYKISDLDTQPFGITLGPDGNVWFIEEKTQKVGVLNVSDNSAIIPVHISGLYGSSQAAKNQSFLRIANTASNGSVTITLFDASSGQQVGQWTSPIIAPGTSRQFAMATIESNTLQPIQNKPAMYTALIQPQFTARLQHIIWNPVAGELSNVSMCSRGTDTAPTQLNFVHTSTVGEQGYSSSVVITNTGGIGQSVTLVITDGNDGSTIGEYVSPLVPKNGQLTVEVPDIEAYLKFKPQSSQSYYTVTAKQPFTGYLQHLLTNVQSNSVITDMSTACVVQPGIG